MMTRMTTAVTAPRERISSGLSTVIRERSNASAGPSRRDKLLGISPGSSPSPLAALIDPDSELREEDVWGGDENSADDLEDPQPAPPPSSSSRFGLKNGRPWLGLEQSPSKDASPLGLSSINRPSVAAAAPVRKSTTSASRMIPHVASFDHHPGKMIQQHQSAPVNIPDWSKILGIDAKRGGGKENGFMDDDDDEEREVGGGGEEPPEEWKMAEEEEEEGVGRSSSSSKPKKIRVPPHELAAREYAKSHTAFSVYEGAGRTLKGMDLRRVRNAVWQQTGFIGG